MLEIDENVVSTIENDATMISLMGITAEDNRVYSWYPAVDIVYTINDKEVSIIYNDSIGKRDKQWSYPSQFPLVYYFFRVESINQLKLGQCAERLIDLFDKTSIETTNWHVKWIILSASFNGDNEGSPTMPIYVKNVIFEFTNVFRKGATG